MSFKLGKVNNNNNSCLRKQKLCEMSNVHTKELVVLNSPTFCYRNICGQGVNYEIKYLWATDQWRTEGGRGLGVQNPHPPPHEIPKALQNRSKINPIVKRQ